MAMGYFKISKRLKNSDIRSKIGLPNQIVEYMIPVMNGRNFLDLKVMDSCSQEWKLRYYTRPNGKKNSPVFTTGWRRFVKAKGLRGGDKFTFYGHQVTMADGEVKMEYKIKVNRPGWTVHGELLTSEMECIA